MSEETDRESKTEKPTQKRLHDAMEKGNWAVSKEVSVFFSHVALLGMVLFLLPQMLGSFLEGNLFFWDHLSDLSLRSSEDVSHLLFLAAQVVLLPLAAPIALFLSFGILASCAQNIPRLIPDRIAPDFKRISLLSGFKKLFSLRSIFEFLKSLIKFTMVTVIAVMVFRAHYLEVLSSLLSPAAVLPMLLWTLVGAFLMAMVAVSLFLVVADVVWTQYSWRRDLKMSKQEVRDEFKAMEGNPMVKARRMARARERSRQRMMARVPKATLILANPTHYCLALKYEKDVDDAPIVIAKGQDFMALRIRDIAKEYDVPIIENPPLVRAMYPICEVDQMIPKEFYRAVAEIIYALYKANKIPKSAPRT